MASRIFKIKKTVFLDLKSAWTHQKRLKTTFLKIWVSREKDMLKTCYDALKNLHKFRETHKELGWDSAEKFKARFVLTRWRKFNRARKHNYKHLIQFN